MKEFKKNIKCMWPFIKEDKWYVFFYLLSNIILILVNIVIPILTSKLMINLTNNQLYQLLIVALIIFIIRIINVYFDYLLEKSFQKMSVNSFTRIQLYICEQILKINNDSLDKTGTGTFTQRITNDARELAELIHWTILYFATTIKDFGIFLAIFIINKYVCLYLIITIILENFIVKKKNDIKSKMDKEYRKINDSTVSFENEFIKGVKDIKMLNAEDSILVKLNKDLTHLNKFNYDMTMKERRYYYFNNFLEYLFGFGLIGLFIILIYYGKLEVASAIILYNYSGQVPYIASHFGYFLESFKDFNLSATRVFELADNDIFEKEQFGNRHLRKIKGDFEFENVEFSYGKNKVLDNTSFKVDANTTVAFVGKSGVGKSTIFNLLCKMYDIDEGTIFIDGINIKELDKDSIRGNITIISQNPYLFNMSIRDNLRLVKSDLTETEMIEALKTACLDEYINTLPDKYDTIIGEGGVNLSGGQKQRLAIARALVQNTEIILFDEATSALDNETQLNIQKAIENMKNKYTILIVAHRLSTIINCDKIMYLDNGRIIASGTHEELLKKSSEYKKLYENELR